MKLLEMSTESANFKFLSFDSLTDIYTVNNNDENISEINPNKISNNLILTFRNLI